MTKLPLIAAAGIALAALSTPVNEDVATFTIDTTEGGTSTAFALDTFASPRTVTNLVDILPVYYKDATLGVVDPGGQVAAVALVGEGTTNWLPTATGTWRLTHTSGGTTLTAEFILPAGTGGLPEYAAGGAAGVEAVTLTAIRATDSPGVWRVAFRPTLKDNATLADWLAKSDGKVCVAVSGTLDALDDATPVAATLAGIDGDAALIDVDVAATLADAGAAFIRVVVTE